MSRFNTKLFLSLSVAALFAASRDLRAEEAPVNELPPVVIEAATLEAKPLVKAKPKAQPQPVAVEEPEPEPAKAQKKIKKAVVAEKTNKTSAPTNPPASTEGQSASPAAAASGGETTPTATSSVDGISAEKVGASVSVVTGAELRAQEVQSTGDALRSLPGISVNHTNGITGLTQIRIRGAEANHTMILIDGIEANETTTGEFYFSDLSPENIDQIEVIRGPQSGLYGSGALGGVINVVTNKGRGPLTFSGSASGGSFGTSDLLGRVSAGTDKAWGSISFHQLNTNGFDVAPAGNENDSGKQQTFALKAGVKISDDVTVDFNLRNVSKTGDRDGFGGPAGTLGTAIDDPSTFTTDIWLAGVKVRWDTFDGALSHEFRASNNRTSRTDHDLSFPAFPFNSRNDSETSKYGYLATLRFDTPMFVAARHTLSGLIEKSTEDFTPLSEFEDGVTRGREQLATVGEYRGEFYDRLYLTGSLRHDNNSTFEDTTTWRANASLALREIGIRPHSSAGTGVKLPTQFEQFGSLPSFFIPNPSLKPEKSFGWDAGVEATLLDGGIVIDVTYFKSNLENEITTVGFPSTPINLDGQSHRQGVEIGGKVRLTPELVLGASYTYLDAADPNGVEEVRRAPHSGRADLTYAFNSGLGHINVAAVYNGAMQDLAFRLPIFSQERVMLSDYWLVNVGASYKIAPGVEMYGRVENLLDTNYQEVYGFETAGISAYAGLRFTYEEPLTKDWAKYK